MRQSHLPMILAAAYAATALVLAVLTGCGIDLDRDPAPQVPPDTLAATLATQLTADTGTPIQSAICDGSLPEPAQSTQTCHVTVADGVYTATVTSLGANPDTTITFTIAQNPE